MSLTHIYLNIEVGQVVNLQNEQCIPRIHLTLATVDEAKHQKRPLIKTQRAIMNNYQVVLTNKVGSLFKPVGLC